MDDKAVEHGPPHEARSATPFHVNSLLLGFGEPARPAAAPASDKAPTAEESGLAFDFLRNGDLSDRPVGSLDITTPQRDPSPPPQAEVSMPDEAMAADSLPPSPAPAQPPVAATAAAVSQTAAPWAAALVQPLPEPTPTTSSSSPAPLPGLETAGEGDGETAFIRSWLAMAAIRDVPTTHRSALAEAKPEVETEFAPEATIESALPDFDEVLGSRQWGVKRPRGPLGILLTSMLAAVLLGVALVSTSMLRTAAPSVALSLPSHPAPQASGSPDPSSLVPLTADSSAPAPVSTDTGSGPTGTAPNPQAPVPAPVSNQPPPAPASTPFPTDPPSSAPTPVSTPLPTAVPTATPTPSPQPTPTPTPRPTPTPVPSQTVSINNGTLNNSSSTCPSGGSRGTWSCTWSITTSYGGVISASYTAVSGSTNDCLNILNSGGSSLKKVCGSGNLSASTGSVAAGSYRIQITDVSHATSKFNASITHY